MWLQIDSSRITPSVSEADVDPKHNILTGWIKLRNAMKNWKNRWFVLRSGRLIYYKAEKVGIFRFKYKRGGKGALISSSFRAWQKIIAWVSYSLPTVASLNDLRSRMASRSASTTYSATRSTINVALKERASRWQRFQVCVSELIPPPARTHTHITPPHSCLSRTRNCHSARWFRTGAPYMDH